MKIQFQKISNQPVSFELESGDLKFFVDLRKKSDKLLFCNARIFGNLAHNCDRCGDDIVLGLDENLTLLISDGIYTQSENELDDVVEFFNGEIDLDELFLSEIEAFKSDYFYCENCKNL